MNPLLLPVVAVQGRSARARIEVLPEAAGPTTGTTAGAADDPLRVLVLGESTAAGCGAATHDGAFAGQLALALSGRGRAVRWQVHGRHGATIRRVRYRILPEVQNPADVAVLLIGVNDVLARTPAARWRDDLTSVVQSLAAHASRTVVAGIPPFDEFPSLPRPLRTYLGERGRALDDVAQEVCASVPAVSWASSGDLASADATFFARDGFHPSPAGYRRWAQDIAIGLDD